MRNRACADRLDADRRALAADPEMIRYARGQAKFYARKFPSLADEFESAALLALVEAARTFDTGQGVTFRTHAVNRIRGAILDAKRVALPSGYRRRGRDERPAVVSIESVVLDGTRATTLGSTLPADELPVGWEEEYQDELRGLARRASIRAARRVLPLYYGSAAHATMKRTAEATGRSESRISQVHEEAIDDLRQLFGDGRDIFMRGTGMLTREELRRGVSVGGYEDDADGARPEDAGSNGTRESLESGRLLGSCPECGKPYVKRRRCFDCSPIWRKKEPGAAPRVKAPARVTATSEADSNGRHESAPGPEPIPAPPPPTVPLPPAASSARPIRRELRAIRDIDRILARLDAESAASVLAFVNRHYNTGAEAC